ncbi:MAG: sulfatase-like hydrolase/transferase [Planctomycetes bacterium]|nr:sulfatase-like hydrolase/transferase [Planctomycetota bacterium]
MMSTRPNILLILTDEQRLTELAAYGETPCKTPNLDRLAQRSVRFTNAYTTCPLCSPARASVITGLYPHSHGVTVNTDDIGCNVSELIDSPRLLPRKLGAAGYRCGYTGKWHLGTARGNAFGSGRPAALPSHFGFVGQDFPGHGGGGFGYPEYQEYLRRHGFRHEVTGKLDTEPLTAGVLTGPVESTVPLSVANACGNWLPSSWL